MKPINYGRVVSVPATGPGGGPATPLAAGMFRLSAQKSYVVYAQYVDRDTDDFDIVALNAFQIAPVPPVRLVGRWGSSAASAIERDTELPRYSIAWGLSATFLELAIWRARPTLANNQIRIHVSEGTPNVHRAPDVLDDPTNMNADIPQFATLCRAHRFAGATADWVDFNGVVITAAGTPEEWEAVHPLAASLQLNAGSPQTALSWDCIS